MADDIFEVFALKYAERNSRTRADSFQFDDDHASPHAMDYFVWVARNKRHTILIDTGYGEAEAKRRGRPILRDPSSMLQQVGITPPEVTDVIVTHLHYDHAGGLDDYEYAKIHMQEAELGFAVSGCMCHSALKAPFTAEHICSAVKKLYSGKVSFSEGSSQIFPGMRVHKVGGHSAGLQIVEVDTALGPLILASDASHYYENFETDRLFPIVVDPPAMLEGFSLLRKFQRHGAIIVPGHDPLVMQRYAGAKKNTSIVRIA